MDTSHVHSWDSRGMSVNYALVQGMSVNYALVPVLRKANPTGSTEASVHPDVLPVYFLTVCDGAHRVQSWQRALFTGIKALGLLST